MSSRQAGLEASTHFWSYQNSFLSDFQGVDKPCYKLLKPGTELPLGGDYHLIVWAKMHLSYVASAKNFAIVIRELIIIVQIRLTCWEISSHHFTVSSVLESPSLAVTQPLVPYDDDVLVAPAQFLGYVVFCLAVES